MVDIVITAASVAKGGNALVQQGTAGASITAGQAVYLDSATGRYLLSDNDGTGTKQVDGIALNGAATGQPLAVQRGGDITIGATLTPGTAYYLSATVGGICPVADVAVGDDVILIGLAKSATNLSLRITDTGVTL